VQPREMQRDCREAAGGRRGRGPSVHGLTEDTDELDGGPAIQREYGVIVVLEIARADPRHKSRDNATECKRREPASTKVRDYLHFTSSIPTGASR
jgi:hypothetical protein